MADEPVPHLAHRQPVPHHHRPRADKAFPALAEPRALDRTPGRVGPVEHPYRLAMLGGGFEDVEQGRHIGVDAAAQILQVDEHHVEGVHRLPRRPPHLAIEAEHRHAVSRIGEVGRLHHIVLKVAAHAMLRPEHRGDVDPRRDEGVNAVGQVGGDRGGVREQRHALALERRPKRGGGEQAVDAEEGRHARPRASSVSAKQSG